MDPLAKIILLVDDDEDDRDFFKAALSSIVSGINLVTLNDGVSLMNYLNINRDNPPYLIFLDINMPRKTGLECLSELRKLAWCAHVPVVMYTTSDNEFDVLNAASNGANMYLKKPNDFKRMKNVIQQVIETDWSTRVVDKDNFFI